MEPSNSRPSSSHLADGINSDTGEWFYSQRGDVYGPVSTADLCAAAHLGFLGPDDLVRRAHDLRWTAARLIKGLFVLRPHDSEAPEAEVRIGRGSETPEASDEPRGAVTRIRALQEGPSSRIADTHAYNAQRCLDEIDR